MIQDLLVRGLAGSPGDSQPHSEGQREQKPHGVHLLDGCVELTGQKQGGDRLLLLFLTLNSPKEASGDGTEKEQRTSDKKKLGLVVK